MPIRPLLLSALLLPAFGTHAALLVVTTTRDVHDGQCNSHCSLRDAVTVANQTPGLSTIQLPPGQFGLSLRSSVDQTQSIIDEQDNQVGDLDVSGELHIIGSPIPYKNGLSNIWNDGNDDRLIEVLPGGNLTLENLDLEKGRTYFEGGAVKNWGQLLLNNIGMYKNLALEASPQDTPSPGKRAYGGAIANYGTLTVLSSKLKENQNVSPPVGMGGAIYNEGELLVRYSTLEKSRSSSGGALYNRGNATFERSTIATNGSYGGVLTNYGGVLTLTNSTLYGNVGIVLTNGGAVDPSGSKLILNHVTIANNYLYPSTRNALENWGELVIRNSLIAGNYTGTGPADFVAANCANLGWSFSYQAIGLLLNDDPSNCSADLYAPFEKTFTEVLSRDTTSYDGQTFFALHPGSLAIDAGIGKCASKDQRGVARPKDGNGDGVVVCDLGAYELTP